MHLCDTYQQDLLALCPLPQLIADNSALLSPIQISCSVCTTYAISAFQRLYEFSEKHFLSHQEGLLSLNIFPFLFLPFYTSLFILFIDELSIFYLSVLHLWFLLCLALYLSLSILSTVRYFKFLEYALHHFFCHRSFLYLFLFWEIHLFNSPEKQVRTKKKALLKLMGNSVSVTFAQVVGFFNWPIIQRCLVLPTKRKRNISKRRERNPFAFRP